MNAANPQGRNENDETLDAFCYSEPFDLARHDKSSVHALFEPLIRC